jgi:hypothetical protein
LKTTKIIQFLKHVGKTGAGWYLTQIARNWLIYFSVFFSETAFTALVMRFQKVEALPDVLSLFLIKTLKKKRFGYIYVELFFQNSPTGSARVNLPHPTWCQPAPSRHFFGLNLFHTTLSPKIS